MKNLVLNSLHSLGVTSHLRSKKQGLLTVLSLHRISDERNSFWNPIKPSTFDQLLAYLKKNYAVIGFRDLDRIDSLPQDRPFVILSFDDGYYDFYEHALPLLVKHNLPSNHNFVNECVETSKTIWTERLNKVFEHHKSYDTGSDLNSMLKDLNLPQFEGTWMPFYIAVFQSLLSTPKTEREKVIQHLESRIEIDTSCRMMNWEEIKESAAYKVELGSHTYTHDSLGTITQQEILEKEIITAKTEMEHKLGEPVDILALPNGQTGPMADQVISNSDYKFVLYVNERLNPLPLKSGDSPIKINRINLIDEPFPQMALRIEQFHEMLRKYVG